MKHILFAILIFTALATNAQQHSLEKLWETDSVVAIPESVLYDSKNSILYISLINGAPWEADGKGGVGKLSTDGKTFDSTWITGLHAPKGMGQVGNRLYVADMNEVVVIDIQNGKIEKKIKIDSAQGLNDITVTDKGIIYVSDSRTAKVYRVENDVPALYLKDMTGVNGLRAVGNDLYILSGKSFVKADAQKAISKVVELEQGGDGLEPIGNGDFIATSWGGWIYYVHANGKIETLLDTHLEKKNTADIGYDAAKKIIYVPTFNAKRVVAYQLK
jgi:hypothetical protein